MRFWLYIAFFIPLTLFPQQTVEICNDSKTFSYSTQSDINSIIEWNVNGQYYYGNEINITWNNPGIYEITATAISNDCPSIPQTYTVTVIECDPLLVWVPNTFTPNGDEYNTTWGPVVNGPVDIHDFHLVVFNRWGELVWESNNPNAVWDGTFGGKSVTDGVYTWVIDFGIIETDERRLIHGHVTILR